MMLFGKVIERLASSLAEIRLGNLRPLAGSRKPVLLHLVVIHSAN